VGEPAANAGRFRLAHCKETFSARGVSVYIHAFVFRWKQKVDQNQVQRIKEAILDFEGKIPGLVEVHAGINLAVNRKDYEFGGVMKFVDKEALDAYQVHPQHKQLLGWLAPLIDAVELDFEA
jgi:hypothetical protein